MVCAPLVRFASVHRRLLMPCVSPLINPIHLLYPPPPHLSSYTSSWLMQEDRPHSYSLFLPVSFSLYFPIATRISNSTSVSALVPLRPSRTSCLLLTHSSSSTTVSGSVLFVCRLRPRYTFWSVSSPHRSTSSRASHRQNHSQKRRM